MCGQGLRRELYRHPSIRLDHRAPRAVKTCPRIPRTVTHPHRTVTVCRQGWGTGFLGRTTTGGHGLRDQLANVNVRPGRRWFPPVCHPQLPVGTPPGPAQGARRFPVGGPRLPPVPQAPPAPLLEAPSSGVRPGTPPVWAGPRTPGPVHSSPPLPSPRAPEGPLSVGLGALVPSVAAVPPQEPQGVPASPAVSPQPVPESVRSAATAVPQCTVPPRARPGAAAQGVPMGPDALQPAMSGAPLEVVRLAALLPQQREVSPWGLPNADASPGHMTRAASPRTAPSVAPAPAAPVALLAPPWVLARLEPSGARAPHAHATYPLSALPPALLGEPASHAAAAPRTQPVAVAGDVGEPACW